MIRLGDTTVSQETSLDEAAGPLAAAGAVAQRNPGPCWGYAFLRIADKYVPEGLYRPARGFGTLIAMGFMPAQRRHSRAYLERILGRRPRFRDLFRHFFAFEETLMLKLRLANGLQVPCGYGRGEVHFRRWMEEGGPVLLGSMHIGVSDMLGMQIGATAHRRIHLVRLRVGNSHDTERIEAAYGDYVNFIWVNDPKELLFALKEAALGEDAIALKCDRLEHATKTECFQFLGARRRFPFTIYYLALLFRRPVLLSVGVTGPEGSILHTTPRFELIPGESKSAALQRARRHFQEYLDLVEEVLRENPYAWFNFTELNPEVSEQEAAQT